MTDNTQPTEQETKNAQAIATAAGSAAPGVATGMFIADKLAGSAGKIRDKVASAAGKVAASGVDLQPGAEITAASLVAGRPGAAAAAAAVTAIGAALASRTGKNGSKAEQVQAARASGKTEGQSR